MRRTMLALAAAALLALPAAACNGDEAGPATATATPTTTATPSTEPTATATPAATETATATPTPVASCVEGDAAELPASRPALGDVGEVARAYLAGGGTAAELESALEAWDYLPEGGAVEQADMVGDGTEDVTDETVIVAFDMERAGVFGPPGAVFVVGCTGGEYRVLHASTDLSEEEVPVPEEARPALVALEDLTDDGQAEALYTVETCGAHTCNLSVLVIGSALDGDGLANLLAEPVAGVPSGEVGVSDEDGDRASEVIVDVGMIGSVGAGPQRTYRETHDWDGTAYVLAERVVTTPPDQWSAIHFVADGDEAARAGDYDRALELYESLLLDPPAEDQWTGPEELAALQTYARYRTMVTHALAGDDAEVRAAATVFAEHEPAPGDPPGFADIGRVFWDEYEATQDAEQACAAAVAYARANTASFEVLNAFGYANPQYEPEDLCPA